jgi:hypothetical protein
MMQLSCSTAEYKQDLLELQEEDSMAQWNLQQPNVLSKSLAGCTASLQPTDEIWSLTPSESKAPVEHILSGRM